MRHLGVDPANARALGFHARLGFTEVAVPSVPGAVFLARPAT